MVPALSDILLGDLHREHDANLVGSGFVCRTGRLVGLCFVQRVVLVHGLDRCRRRGRRRLGKMPEAGQASEVQVPAVDQGRQDEDAVRDQVEQSKKWTKK